MPSRLRAVRQFGSDALARIRCGRIRYSGRMGRFTQLVLWIAAVAYPVHAQAEREVRPAPPSKGWPEVYEQWVDAGGLPIVGSFRVSPFALLEAASIVDGMLRWRSDLRAKLAAAGGRVVVMAPTELTTDVHEFADLEPADYWDRRARGLGGTRARPITSCGEENLLAYAGDPYAGESILVHELAHTLHAVVLDAAHDRALRAAYEAAMAAGRWEGCYAARDHREYWAEGVQTWFHANAGPNHDHNEIDTRAELRDYDPGLAALVEGIFGAGGWRHVDVRDRVRLEHLRGYRKERAPGFRWPDDLQPWSDRDEARHQFEKRRAGEDEVAWTRRLAEAGEPWAQANLGWRYHYGKGVDVRHATAAIWYGRAADRGEPAGLTGLASLHVDGWASPATWSWRLDCSKPPPARTTRRHSSDWAPGSPGGEVWRGIRGVRSAGSGWLPTADTRAPRRRSRSCSRPWNPRSFAPASRTRAAGVQSARLLRFAEGLGPGGGEMSGGRASRRSRETAPGGRGRPLPEVAEDRFRRSRRTAFGRRGSSAVGRAGRTRFDRVRSGRSGPEPPAGNGAGSCRRAPVHPDCRSMDLPLDVPWRDDPLAVLGRAGLQRRPFGVARSAHGASAPGPGPARDRRHRGGGERRARSDGLGLRSALRRHLRLRRAARDLLAAARRAAEGHLRGGRAAAGGLPAGLARNGDRRRGGPHDPGRAGGARAALQRRCGDVRRHVHGWQRELQRHGAAVRGGQGRSGLHGCRRGGQRHDDAVDAGDDPAAALRAAAQGRSSERGRSRRGAGRTGRRHRDRPPARASADARPRRRRRLGHGASSRAGARTPSGSAFHA